MDTGEVWEMEGSQDVRREMIHEMFERQRKTMPRKRRRSRRGAEEVYVKRNAGKDMRQILA